MNLVPVKMADDIQLTDIAIEEKTFKGLNLKEAHLEEFIRKNPSLLVGEEESLLIIGQQVINTEGGRSDLTAINQDGDLVLLEIKRDAEDIKGRKEPFEFQAIRYAANCAKIDSIHELVEKIFAPYIEKHLDEFPLGELSSYEKGIKILTEFLSINHSTHTFNKKQQIILAASSFDDQTLSAVAWLINNNVDISCFTLQPICIQKDHFLNIEKILPVQKLEAFYVGVMDKKEKSKTKSANSGASKTTLPRIPKLLEAGLLKAGDVLYIKGKDKNASKAIVLDANYVKHENTKMTYSEWGKKITGWSTICIYDWAVRTSDSKTLSDLREELL